MQNLFKDFFYFSRGEKRGILMLIATICIVFLAGYLISAWQRRDQTSLDDKVIQAIAQQEYEEFIASLEEKEQSGEKQYTSYKPKKVESIPVILASFNPNTAEPHSHFIHIFNVYNSLCFILFANINIKFLSSGQQIPVFFV